MFASFRGSSLVKLTQTYKFNREGFAPSLFTRMNRYKLRFSKENTGKLFSTVVEASTEQEAFLKAVKLAEEKGVNVPDEVWTNITLLT